ncbi:hypothetical protein [Streptacidiphilus rugosus]|uniref:hypothetical protein n=1 Tax=Streptacidiphilus rugosus TaxID=405783 RepID=UPI000B232761|nr:hypothetical protein [Streptacidiphilus rugosus]
MSRRIRAVIISVVLAAAAVVGINAAQDLGWQRHSITVADLGWQSAGPSAP